jgi:hypothetical protein
MGDQSNSQRKAKESCGRKKFYFNERPVFFLKEKSEDFLDPS